MNNVPHPYSTVFVLDHWRDTNDNGAWIEDSSERFLHAVLRQVGFSSKEYIFIHVFDLIPDGKNVQNLCGPKTEGIKGWPSVSQNKYVLAKYKPHLDNVFKEIENVNPNLVVLCGPVATWAFLKSAGIRNLRGTVELRGGRKFLSTFHPISIIRDYSERPVFFADLKKAARERGSREYRRPERRVWIRPNLQDLSEFERDYISPSPNLSVDIETAQGQITCIGLAPSRDACLVVPFTTHEKANRSYWTRDEEIQVWAWVKRILSLKKVIVGQNFLYDIRYLWEKYGITIPHFTHDTMLLHHALNPELKKGLGFMGSLYTDEASWKFMRTKDMETLKKED